MSGICNLRVHGNLSSFPFTNLTDTSHALCNSPLSANDQLVLSINVSSISDTFETYVRSEFLLAIDSHVSNMDGIKS